MATNAVPFAASASATQEPGFLPLAGRILIAAIFLLSGVTKLTAPVATIAYIQAAGLPAPALAFALAAATELGAGVLLVLGYRTRMIAAWLALFTLATAFGFHRDLADQNQFIHFFKNIAMAGGLLQIIAFGGGRFSLDRQR